MHDPRQGRQPAGTAGAAALVLLGVSILLLQEFAVTTESINWDEFALFARAVDSVQDARSGYHQ